MPGVDPPSAPFADAVTAAFVDRHYRLVTRPLVDGSPRVPEGREGNFVARDHNQRGQLGPTDDDFTARCIAHSYGVMHYSEMLAFLRRVPEALAGRGIVAVDIGCGIGSALVAARAAAPEGDHRWMGFDPHRETLAMAGAVLGGLIEPLPVLTTTLDASALDRVTRWATPGRRPVLLLSHVLGQRTLTAAALGDLAGWITSLVRSTAGGAGVELLSVEPDRSGVVEQGPALLGLLGRGVVLDAHVDEVCGLDRLETRSTAPIAPFVGPCRKRARWYTLRAPDPTG
ncbi:MAG: hypothetical protein NVS1B12_06060 [Acidimicrobiales bacterium]